MAVHKVEMEEGNFAICLLAFIGKFIYPAVVASIDYNSISVLITLKTISFPGLLQDSNTSVGLLRQPAL